jgi:sulfate adenylyltransferase
MSGPTSRLVKPHGSEDLITLLVAESDYASEKARADSLPKVEISSREFGDLIMLGIGGFTPLTGFMNKADWEGVCVNMHMQSGLFWPIPITLSTDTANADSLATGTDVVLTFNGESVGILSLEEKYSIDKAWECEHVYTTTDLEHPGVKMVMEQGDVNLAGSVKVLSQGDFPTKFGDLYMTPAETRAEFGQRGWSNIAAFQTRNPLHRSHEYLVKIAIELCDGVMIHSLLGNLKPGDIPAEVRAEAIGQLVENYFVDNTVIQSGYPLDMRYAGPREALLHAVFRQNYGCNWLIVGRDHAGVGDYYGPFDAHKIFDELPEGSLQTQPMKIDWTFWCNKCGSMASMKTCPHEAADRMLLSGSKLRKLLSEGDEVPDNFSRPEVLAILRRHYEGLNEEDNVKIEITGASAK